MSQSKRIAMHKRNLLFYLMILLNVCSAVSANTWKVLWYMDASDGLSDMAIKNMTDAMRAKPNAQVEWLIQLHAYFDAGVRYRITKDGLTSCKNNTSGNGDQAYINAAAWAFKNDAQITPCSLWQIMGGAARAMVERPGARMEGRCGQLA